MQCSKIAFLCIMSLATAVVSADSSAPKKPISSPISRDNIIRLVFMGKTGAGKSTSINTFFNHAKGITADTFPKLFPIKTKFQACNVTEYAHRNVEDHRNGQLKAVTLQPSEYTATGDNLVLNLIDCPGMADPEGVTKDVENSRDIVKFINNIGSFNAICIVLKGSTNRGTKEEIYFVEQVKTIIPKSAQNRIFILLTHGTRPSQDAKEFASSVGLPVENVFAFEHFALSEDGHVDPATDDDGSLMGDVNRTWVSSKNAFNRLIAKAKELGEYSTIDMTKIGEIKSKAVEKINTALRKVSAIEETTTKLENARHELQTAREACDRASSAKESTEAALRQAQAEQNAAQALNTYETYYETIKEGTNDINTHCTKCGVNCHEPCGLDDKGPHYNDHIVGCNRMKDGYCTVCPGKCSYTAHFHRKERFVQVQKTRELFHVKDRQASAARHVNEISSTLTEKQNKLNGTSSDKEDKNNNFNLINSCLADLQREKDDLQAQIVEHYVELDKVSMSSIIFQIGEYYDELIRVEKDPVKTATLQRDKKFYVEQVELYKQKNKAHKSS